MKLPVPSWWACTITGNGTDAGIRTVRCPWPLTVTTPLLVDTEVDDGAGGRVDVVTLVVVEADTVVLDAGATADVVLEAAASVGVLESEHAAPNAIDAATSTTTADDRTEPREPVSGRSRV